MKRAQPCQFHNEGLGREQCLACLNAGINRRRDDCTEHRDQFCRCCFYTLALGRHEGPICDDCKTQVAHQDTDQPTLRSGWAT